MCDITAPSGCEKGASQTSWAAAGPADLLAGWLREDSSFNNESMWLWVSCSSSTALACEVETGAEQHEVKCWLLAFEMSLMYKNTDPCPRSHPLRVLLHGAADGRVELGQRGRGRICQGAVLLLHACQRPLQVLPLLRAQGLSSLRQKLLRRPDGLSDALPFGLEVFLDLLSTETKREMLPKPQRNNTFLWDETDHTELYTNVTERLVCVRSHLQLPLLLLQDVHIT